MKRILFVLVVLAGLCTLAGFGFQRARSASPTPSVEEEAIRRAIETAITQENEAVLAYLLYEERIEQIQLSSDGKLARAMLLTVDPDRGQPIEQEPGLAFTRREGDSWVAILPNDPAWVETVRRAPADLLDEEEKAYWLATYEVYRTEIPTEAIGGFYLPWQAGVQRYLTQSVGHDRYTASGSMHYAFDFALNNTHWPIHASRGGTMWMCKEDIPTCTEWTCSQEQKKGNYIVIKDETTTPTTYQLYLHLDYNSIPDNLCNNNQAVVGTPIGQGQVIGMVDNTGQSWGSHLHFQVHTVGSLYFGTAIDITFDDVPINGGRPRVEKYDKDSCRSDDVCDSFQTYYTSGNTGSGDVVPPTGNITNLYDGETISTATLALQGEAADIGDGVGSVQFLAHYRDNWWPAGAPVTANPETPTLDWDWCASNVPDGIVSVAMRITDKGNNVTAFTGLHHVIKSYACPAPPPGCTPTANQVALFSEPNYTGSCKLFGSGTYTTTAALGLAGYKNTASLLVGANVRASLFFDANMLQRGETFLASDNSLSDNLIGADQAAALLVEAKTANAAAAYPRIPAQGATLTQGDVLTFGWDNGGGATQYQVEITGASSLTSPGTGVPFWSTAALPAGSYTWRVQANGGTWSAPRNFTVGAAPALTTTVLTVPISETFETHPERWSGTGLWVRVPVPANHTPEGSYAWWYQDSATHYDTGETHAGNLTSVPISISTPGYYLRFYYKAETESPYVYWDQRWLQISADGGPFTNVWQFTDEWHTGDWLLSPPIDLSAYAGQNIRLRFSFDTLDANRNAYDGWGIDDLSITNSAPASCPADGGTIGYGGSQSGRICPNGDADMYTFAGSAGDEIGANVDAEAIGSSLDPVLTLLDANGNVLAANDDQVTELNRDSLIRFRLPASGTYTLRVSAWDHPSAGGMGYPYTLRLYNDSTRPTVALANPVDYAYLPAGNVPVTATASDTGSGIESVAFFWHDNDWLSGTWQFIGIDPNGSDGWQVPFDTDRPDQLGVAVMARAFDQAGNEAVSAAWNITLDHTPPVSALDAWNETLGSTAIFLHWGGSDNLSGLQRYELQQRIDSAAWTDVLTTSDASTTQAWIVGQTGAITTTYGFRLRAIDNADNAEAYPASAEVSARLPPAEILCSEPDSWEADNTPISATLATTDTLQLHNFCNPALASFQNDEDWLQLNTAGGQSYYVSASPLDQSVAITIEVYASDGTTRIAGPVASLAYGRPISLAWVAPADGVYYIRVRHVNGAIFGNATQYAIEVGTAKLVFLPVINR
ncbi:MAG: pre-peptidase C-terminal domain-containing protein [Chloroflexota bacterium]